MDPTREVLTFWFGRLQGDGRADPEIRRLWWSKDPNFDHRVFERFGGLHAMLNAGARPEWTFSPRGLLAAILVLDQFSRNMFRNTGGMFASDDQALALAFEGIALGYDRRLRIAERCFLYMPLMHSERLDVQNRCVDLFERFAAELPADAADEISQFIPFAQESRAQIQRFGRFPRRNEALGRPSTAEELAWLTESGDRL